MSSIGFCFSIFFLNTKDFDFKNKNTTFHFVCLSVCVCVCVCVYSVNSPLLWSLGREGDTHKCVYVCTMLHEISLCLICLFVCLRERERERERKREREKEKDSEREREVGEEWIDQINVEESVIEEGVIEERWRL